MSPASTWLSSEPYQTISDYSPSLFADSLLFDEEEVAPSMYAGDWSNNMVFSTDPCSGLILDPMDSLFDFEKAAKPGQPALNNMLECQYYSENPDSGC